MAETTLAPCSRAERISVRAGSIPADHLDDDVDVAPGHQRLGVGGEQLLGKVDVARDTEAAYGDTDQLHGRADARGEVAGLLVQQPCDLGADDAAAQQGHLHRALPWGLLIRGVLIHRGPSSHPTPVRA